MSDVRLLSLLLSLAFVLVVVVVVVGVTGNENRITSARTGCGLESDAGRTLPDPRRTAPSGSAEATGTEANSGVSGSKDCSGWTAAVVSVSASACICVSTSGTSVEHVESGDSGGSSEIVCVVGSWKETRRVLGRVGAGGSSCDTPAMCGCDPTARGRAGAVGGGRVGCVGSRPMMRMGVSASGTGNVPEDVAIGDWAIGLRRVGTKMERGRVVDGVSVEGIWIGSSGDGTERRASDEDDSEVDRRAFSLGP